MENNTILLALKIILSASIFFVWVVRCITVFDHFQIDTNIQKVDQSGRPRYLLEGDGRVFLS